MRRIFVVEPAQCSALESKGNLLGGAPVGLFLCAATAAPGQLGWHVGLQLRQGEHDVEQRDAAIFNKAVADSVVLDQVVLVVPVLLPVLLRERSVPAGARGRSVADWSP